MVRNHVYVRMVLLSDSGHVLAYTQASCGDTAFELERTLSETDQASNIDAYFEQVKEYVKRSLHEGQEIEAVRS